MVLCPVRVLISSITTRTEIPYGLILCVLEVFDHRRNLGTDSELEMLWWYRRRVATIDGGGIACASSGSRRDPLVAKLARIGVELRTFGNLQILATAT